ncbi:M20/M25/M40 family metallo-hydrolase [Solimonas soli]|uniref:M20/M25/M40 family metallo-hydrolase n=1 Tax=Solimonas soli TaxID=413479 RepID=UPI00048246BB
MRWIAALSLITLAFAAAAATRNRSPDAPPAPAALFAIADRVDAAQLRATIEALVAFGTRHTLSDTQSESRGIGAARRWVQARFAAIGADCDGCLSVVTPAQTFTGARMAQPTAVVDVVAVQRGSDDPQRVIVISGHLDSRVSDVMDATSDAPGANDDASGVAAVIEAARVLSKYRFRATLVYAALSGEEQGLYGAKVLAGYARAQGWQVQADLNNDIVGNSEGQDGTRETDVVRVFSEGTRSLETLDEAKYRRYHGGEVDSPSRNVARYMAALAERYLPNFTVRMVYRTDRYGRGGDEVPFLEAGYPAVRVTEAHENYARQHQDLRSENGVRYGDTIDGVDFAYLARVTRLNAITMAQMAWAPAPPDGVDVEGALRADTTVKWNAVPGAAAYRVWWRDTTAAQWQHSRDADGKATSLVLQNVVVDDQFFGVSSVSAEGFESPVVFAGAAGRF